ncbi:MULTISPECIES: hypothetical protein [Pseudomonas syringae group]|uniref:hypothetical protein n=1 Tax=Pseudomonas syringae group TaxID=136849 RepID=UPI000EFDC66E|nr:MULTISPECIES: hypothetical protein [Pseudomonas syringae group]MBI6848641.1 hypothetical protein [Pseudomonas syringae]RMV04172.1 putative Membrane protein [Pseudomonas syringae pv. tomato]TES52350.1 hypothetical protein E2N91_29880 [Pseudomonas syringae pv. tomato]
MTTLVQSDLTAQKIRIETFCKRVLIVVLVGLPIFSAAFNLVSWLRFGVDLPYLDDIRPYYNETAGSLRLHDLFTSSNDTLYPLGMALDSLAFRWLSGNTVAYQAISMITVLGGILLIQWKLLEYCLDDKLLSAAAFSSLLLMLQPDSYWGLQNMAYHQVLPLLFILMASLVSVSSLGTKLKCTLGVLLATASGLVYISGAFAFLAFSLAMLIRELFVVKKSQQIISMSILMLIPSVLTSLLQGWVIVGIQHGVHRADTAMSYPWDAEFWIFILSKIARSLYLSDLFPFLSLGIASCGLALLLLISLLSLMVARRYGNYSVLGRVSFVAFPVIAAILVYLGLVAAGRTNLHPASIDSGMKLFTFSFVRFHFFWVCAAWPLVIAAVFAAMSKANKVFPVSLVVVMCFASFALVGGTKITEHDAYYKQTYDIRVENLACLNQGNQRGGQFQCPGLHPGIDMSPILRYARATGASFAGLATTSPAAFGSTGALYDIGSDKFEIANLTVIDDGNRMAAGADPMIILGPSKLATLPACQLLQVRVRLDVEKADLAQLFYTPVGETLSEINSQVKPVGLGTNDLTFEMKSDKGFAGYLRFDPVTGAQNITVQHLEVRCLYDVKAI